MQTSLLEKSVRASSLILAITVGMLLVTYSFPYLYPFLIVFIVAGLLHPIVSVMVQKLAIPRKLATVLVMGIFFSGTGLIGYLLFMKLIQEGMQFLDTFPLRFGEIKELLLTFTQQTYEQLNQFFPFLGQQNMEANLSMELVKSVVLTSTDIIHSVSYFGLISIFTLLAVYLVTNDFPLFQTQAKKLVPKRLLHIPASFITQFGRSFTGLLRAQIILALLSACLVLIGLLLFGMEHVLLITLLVFVIDFIPYLGIGMLFVPWIAFNFLTQHYPEAIQLCLLYAILILLRNLLEPKLIAQSMGIHPFIALSVLFLATSSP